MRQSSFLALGGLIASVCASPHARHLDLHKREVIHTHWEKVVVTKTITLLPGQHPPSKDQYQPQAADAKKAPADNAPAQSTPESKPVDQHQHEKYKAPKQQQKAAPVQPAASPATVNKLAEANHPQPQPQPTTAPTHEPPPSSSAEAPPSTSTGDSSGGSGPSGGVCGSVGGKCSGDATMYDDQGAGACGWTNDTNTDEFFALARGMFFDKNPDKGYFGNDAPGPHKNVHCGRKANIVVNGRTVSGTLTDACGGCQGQSIDLSKALWNKVYPGQAPTRMYDVEWYFTDAEIYSGPGY